MGSPGGTRSGFPWHNESLACIGTSFCLLLSPCAESAEPSGDRSRSEFARSSPACPSAAHFNLKSHSGWFGPPTLYACPLQHAMEVCCVLQSSGGRPNPGAHPAYLHWIGRRGQEIFEKLAAISR